MPISVSSIRDNSLTTQGTATTPVATDMAMKNAFIASGILHLVVVIISIIGLPFITKSEPLTITPISIELVDISDVTQTDRRAPPKKEDTPKEIEKPEPPKPAEPKPKPPEPEPIPEPEPEPKVEKVKEEPPKPEPIIEPKKEEPKPIEKPKEKPKEQPKPKEKEKPKENAFDSLLKDLTPEEDAPKPQEKTMEDVVEDSTSGQIANLADKLSISELDAFKYQLEPCWNVPAGAKFAENLAVEVRVTMQRDGTVKNASVLDTGRYNRDSAYRAAADSALRALRNPRCSPLKLPPDKYDQWKSIIINFDPQDML